jgi:hypothetical protein
MKMRDRTTNVVGSGDLEVKRKVLDLRQGLLLSSQFRFFTEFISLSLVISFLLFLLLYKNQFRRQPRQSLPGLNLNISK